VIDIIITALATMMASAPQSVFIKSNYQRPCNLLFDGPGNSRACIPKFQIHLQSQVIHLPAVFKVQELVLKKLRLKDIYKIICSSSEFSGCSGMTEWSSALLAAKESILYNELLPIHLFKEIETFTPRYGLPRAIEFWTLLERIAHEFPGWGGDPEHPNHKTPKSRREAKEIGTSRRIFLERFIPDGGSIEKVEDRMYALRQLILGCCREMPPCPLFDEASFGACYIPLGSVKDFLSVHPPYSQTKDCHALLSLSTLMRILALICLTPTLFSLFLSLFSLFSLSLSFSLSLNPMLLLKKEQMLNALNSLTSALTLTLIVTRLLKQEENPHSILNHVHLKLLNGLTPHLLKLKAHLNPNSRLPKTSPHPLNISGSSETFQ